MTVGASSPILRLHLRGTGAVRPLDIRSLLGLGFHLAILLVTIFLIRFMENRPMFYDMFNIHKYLYINKLQKTINF